VSLSSNVQSCIGTKHVQAFEDAAKAMKIDPRWLTICLPLWPNRELILAVSGTVIWGKGVAEQALWNSRDECSQPSSVLRRKHPIFNDHILTFISFGIAFLIIECLPGSIGCGFGGGFG
jgi:hypothetical protein